MQIQHTSWGTVRSRGHYLAVKWLNGSYWLFDDDDENESLENEVIELAEPPHQLMPEHPLHETHYVIDEVSFCSASLLGHFERRISNHMPINLGAGIGAKAVACYQIKYMSKSDMLGARL